MPDTIIKIKDGVIRQQKNTILKQVNLEIQSGEFVYLIGKVGSGKSSLLKTLYAELPLEYGMAEVAGFQLQKIKKSHIPLLRRKCGIVFQDFKLLIDRNVYANLEFVLRATGWKNKKAIRERIENVLAKVDMSDKQDKMPHQLSGGEQQRIVLARALLNSPPLILADEPTGNIDPETSYRLIELLKEICEAGKTVIIATHQYDLLEKYPGRVFCCENGTLYEKQETEAVSYTYPEESEPETPLAEASVTDPVSDVSLTEKPEFPDEGVSLPPLSPLNFPEVTAFDYEIPMEESYSPLPFIGDLPQAKNTVTESVETTEDIPLSSSATELPAEENPVSQPVIPTSISPVNETAPEESVTPEETENRKKETSSGDSDLPVFDLELID